MEHTNSPQGPKNKMKKNAFPKFFLFLGTASLLFLASYFYFAGSFEKIGKKEKEVKYIEEIIDEDKNEEKKQKEETKDTQVNWASRRKIDGMGLINTEVLPRRIEDYEYYYMGEIQEEKYEGWQLIMVATPCWGYCPSLPYLIGAKKNGDFIVFGKHSTVPEEAYDIEENYFTRELEIDNDYILNDLVYPEKITYSDKGAVFSRIGRVFNSLWLDEDRLEEIFFHEEYGQAYTDHHHGIYFRASDTTMVVYNLKVGFDSFDVKWHDNTFSNVLYINSDYHTVSHVSYYLDIVEDLDIEKELKEIGINSKGEKIYFPIDSEHKVLQSAYRNMGGFSPSTGREVSYKEFLENKPVFFWIDPLDRLVKFTNSEFMPHAEMAKPVIYLYPEEEQEIWVEVSPLGGITVSDPEYNEGWHVFAKPSGELREINTNKNYSYLFWEGGGELYEQPEEGFMIKQKDVHGFLIKKLSIYGFNKKEIDDFLEFWLPFMQDDPYYFITFLETEAMDKLAPLRVVPEPETIIRILMDFSPLDQPMEVKRQEIKPQERSGFTLMEWGGIIRP